MDTLVKEVTKLEQKNSHLLSEQIRSNGTIAKLKDELLAQSKRHHELEMALVSAHGASASMRSTVDQLRHEVAALQQDVKDKSNLIENEMKEKTALQSKLEAERQTFASKAEQLLGVLRAKTEYYVKRAKQFLLSEKELALPDAVEPNGAGPGSDSSAPASSTLPPLQAEPSLKPNVTYAQDAEDAAAYAQQKVRDLDHAIWEHLSLELQANTSQVAAMACMSNCEDCTAAVNALHERIKAAAADVDYCLLETRGECDNTRAVPGATSMAILALLKQSQQQLLSQSMLVHEGAVEHYAAALKGLLKSAVPGAGDEGASSSHHAFSLDPAEPSRSSCSSSSSFGGSLLDVSMGLGEPGEGEPASSSVHAAAAAQSGPGPSTEAAGNGCATALVEPPSAAPGMDEDSEAAAAAASVPAASSPSPAAGEPGATVSQEL